MQNIVRVYKLVTHILPYVLCSLLFGLFWHMFKVIQGQARTFGFIMVIVYSFGYLMAKYCENIKFDNKYKTICALQLATWPIPYFAQ